MPRRICDDFARRDGHGPSNRPCSGSIVGMAGPGRVGASALALSDRLEPPDEGEGEPGSSSPREGLACGGGPEGAHASEHPTQVRALAEIAVDTLAPMHGPAQETDGSASLRVLADLLDQKLAGLPPADQRSPAESHEPGIAGDPTVEDRGPGPRWHAHVAAITERQPNPCPPIESWLASAVALLFAAACSDESEPHTAAAEPHTESTTTQASALPAADDEWSDESPCGVTLAEIQELLGEDSGVNENATPDPGRCNFTWDDDGPRGIDVAIVPGGRESFPKPDGYEPLDGYGDEAYLSVQPGRTSAFAFVDDDLYAADVVADGSAADMQALCLQLLDLALG